MGKEGDIEYENIKKKKRGHRNGNIEKTGTSKMATSNLKLKKLISKIIPQYRLGCWELG